MKSRRGIWGDFLAAQFPTRFGRLRNCLPYLLTIPADAVLRPSDVAHAQTSWRGYVAFVCLAVTLCIGIYFNLHYDFDSGWLFAVGFSHWWLLRLEAQRCGSQARRRWQACRAIVLRGAPIASPAAPGPRRFKLLASMHEDLSELRLALFISEAPLAASQWLLLLAAFNLVRI